MSTRRILSTGAVSLVQYTRQRAQVPVDRQATICRGDAAEDSQSDHPPAIRAQYWFSDRINARDELIDSLRERYEGRCGHQLRPWLKGRDLQRLEQCNQLESSDATSMYINMWI